MLTPAQEIQRYSEAKTTRAPYELEWKQLSAHCVPRQYGGWQSQGAGTGVNYGNHTMGQKSARMRAVDSKAMLAVPKWMAVVERMTTPQSQRWHGLGTSNTELNKIRAVREWYQAATNMLFKRRYEAKSRFVVTQNESNLSLCVYGNSAKYIAKRPIRPHMPQPGIIYKAIPLRDMFWLTDAWGNIDTYFRRMTITARQFMQMWPKDPPPPSIAAELKNPVPSDTRTFEFFHVVCPNEEYTKGMLGRGGKPWLCRYISVSDQMEIGEPTGDTTNPYNGIRHWTEAGDPYGYSPASQAFPAISSKSAMKRTVLKQGQKAVDPVLLAYDDGVLSQGMDLIPGRINFGALDNQGRELVKPMQMGSFVVAEKMMDAEDRDIEDAFFVALLQRIADAPAATATEIMEQAVKDSALVAPTMGLMQTEDLDPMIDRELDLLAQMNMLDPMPPELIEARGEYESVYTSPFAKSQRSDQVAGFNRTVSMTVDIVKVTGDATPLAAFNFGQAIKDIADIQNVPLEWMADDATIAQAQSDKQTATQQSQLVEAAPAVASVLKTVQGAQPQQRKAA